VVMVFAAMMGFASAQQCGPRLPTLSGNAYIQVSVLADADCMTVVDEIEARIAGFGDWRDPRNVYGSTTAGDYNLMDTDFASPTSMYMETARSSEIQLFTLFDHDGGCRIDGCSLSQGSSNDESVNYCDLRNLYCGSADGCKTAVHHNMTTKEIYVGGHGKQSRGAGHDRSKCVVKPKPTPAGFCECIACNEKLPAPNARKGDFDHCGPQTELCTDHHVAWYKDVNGCYANGCPADANCNCKAQTCQAPSLQANATMKDAKVKQTVFV